MKFFSRRKLPGPLFELRERLDVTWGPEGIEALRIPPVAYMQLGFEKIEAALPAALADAAFDGLRTLELGLAPRDRRTTQALLRCLMERARPLPLRRLSFGIGAAELPVSERMSNLDALCTALPQLEALVLITTNFEVSTFPAPGLRQLSLGAYRDLDEHLAGVLSQPRPALAVLELSAPQATDAERLSALSTLLHTPQLPGLKRLGLHWFVRPSNLDASIEIILASPMPARLERLDVVVGRDLDISPLYEHCPCEIDRIADWGRMH